MNIINFFPSLNFRTVFFDGYNFYYVEKFAKNTKKEKNKKK